jgi:hypothetical protein
MRTSSVHPLAPGGTGTSAGRTGPGVGGNQLPIAYIHWRLRPPPSVLQSAARCANLQAFREVRGLGHELADHNMSEGEKETVAVLGLGRLGLCFAVVLEQAGYRVGPLGARVCACPRPSVAARAAMRLLEARSEV